MFRVDDYISDSDETPRSGGEGDVPVTWCFQDEVIILGSDGRSPLYNAVTLVSVPTERVPVEGMCECVEGMCVEGMCECV